LCYDVKPKEHDVEDDNGYYGSCCSTRVSTLVEDMKSNTNALHDFGALFLWDVRLGKDHGEISVMNLELHVMPCVEEDSVIVSLISHGGIGACVDARAKDLVFEDSKPRKNT